VEYKRTASYHPTNTVIAQCTEDANPVYTVIRSRRRTVAIQITAEGQVLVRCPNRMPAQAVDAFVREKADWIQKNLERNAAFPRPEPFSKAEIQAFAIRTRELLDRRLPLLARKIGVTYHRVTVRSQRTRWGSCSSKGNLNFNCLLCLVPPEVFDYVVIHELCHIKEMNHSARFWTEVEKHQPQYKTHRTWLKEQGSALIRRL